MAQLQTVENTTTNQNYLEAFAENITTLAGKINELADKTF